MEKTPVQSLPAAPVLPEKNDPGAGFFNLLGKISALQSFLSLLTDLAKNYAPGFPVSQRAALLFQPAWWWIVPLLALCWILRRYLGFPACR